MVYLFLAALIIRVLYWLTPPLDSDSATVGLMALHILKGEFPLFFIGGHYGGALEAYLVSLVFLLFGANRWTLPLSTCFEFFVFLGIYRLWAKKWFSTETARWALAWLALSPPLLLYYSCVSFLEYIWLLLFGTLIIYFFSSLYWDARQVEKKESHLVAGMGLLAGLAWWVQYQAVYYIFPVTLLLLTAKPWRWSLKQSGVAVIFFILGGLPFWVYNLGHQWISLSEAGKFSSAAPFGQSLGYILAQGLPVALNLFPITAPKDYLPFPRQPLVPYLSMGLLWLLPLGFGLLLWAQRRFFFSRRPDQPRLISPRAFLLVFLLSYLAIFSASGLAGEKADRHLLPLYTVIPVFLGLMADQLSRWKRPARWLLGVLLCGLNLYGLWNFLPLADARKWERYQTIRQETRFLLDFLREQNLLRVYHFNYWIGTQMTFEAGEKIVFANPIHEPYPVYLQAVNRSPRAAYLFINHPNLPFENTMRVMGASFKRQDSGRWEIYYGLTKIQPQGKRIPAGSPLLPRSRDLGLTLDLGRVYPRGIELRMAGIPPERVLHGLSWEGSSEGETWHPLMTSRDLFFLPLDWVTGQPRFKKESPYQFFSLPGEPLRYLKITPTGEDPVSFPQVGFQLEAYDR
jgi:hypothetical protein